jgi:4-amino-4-deoxy-L-arabinose transferase-like glycosyltransferase
MATHGPLISVAVSSIPEVPLTLCYLISAYGFLGLVVLGRRDSIFYWAAYGGAGLGVAVKGMPILLILAYAWSFALANPWRRMAVRDLVHWPSMIAGAAVGLWWYVAMYALHGNESLAMFMSDQVTERVGLSLPVIAKNLGLVVVCYLFASFPWTLPLVFNLSPTRQRGTIAELSVNADPSLARRAGFFVLGWAILMGVVVALVERFAVRYLLAVTPLAAIVLADRLNLQWEKHPAVQTHLLRWLGYALGVLIAAGTTFMALIRWQMIERDLLWIAGGLAAVVALWLCLFPGRRLREPFVRLTFAALALFPIVYLTLEPIALPDSGESMARWLREYGGTASNIAYVGSPAMVSKARVRMNGDLPLIALSDYEDLAISDYEALVLRAKDADCLPHENYLSAMSFTSGYEGIKPLELLKAMAHGGLRPYLFQHRRRYVVVVNGDRVGTTGYTFRSREKLR